MPQISLLFDTRFAESYHQLLIKANCIQLETDAAVCSYEPSTFG